jgi:glycosyltransferase involved in cell wall biosynthesis
VRIAVVGDHAHPVTAPFAGGLEAMTWYLSRWLAQRGHEVTLFAPAGSNVPGVRLTPLDLTPGISDLARHDVSMPDSGFLDAHHAYLNVIKQLTAANPAFDVIQLHSLHPLPVALAHAFDCPTVLTLHSPPTPWLESALRVAGAHAPCLVSVSQANRALWAETMDHIAAIPNGVDLGCWPPGRGQLGSAAWCGRIVPEKAPHLAVAAARMAGLPLRLAGPIENAEYFDSVLAPLLGDDIIYEGLLDHAALSRLIRESVVLLQTPQWDEPFCLAAAEAVASGTPVAAFDRGGLREVLGQHGGVLAEPGDPAALARAALRAAALPRARVRAQAERSLSLDHCGMAYEQLFTRLILATAPAAPDDVSVSLDS